MHVVLDSKQCQNNHEETWSKSRKLEPTAVPMEWLKSKLLLQPTEILSIKSKVIKVMFYGALVHNLSGAWTQRATGEEKLPQNSSLRDLDRFQFIMSRDTKAARADPQPDGGRNHPRPTSLVRPFWFSSGGLTCVWRPSRGSARRNAPNLRLNPKELGDQKC